MIYDLFYETKFISKLPELVGCPITDEEWGQIIDTIERIVKVKAKVLCVGRPIRFKRVLV